MSETTEEVLKSFGLLPSPVPALVFGNHLVLAAEEIRRIQHYSDFDHRPFLPERDRAFPYLLTEEYRRGYACLKFAVARTLQPRLIVEIGTGAGTGAIAMLHGCPQARYLGIDDASKDRTDGWDFVGFTRQKLTEMGARFDILIKDSTKLDVIDLLAACGQPIDLFHVDGDHLYTTALSDCRLAWASGATWILVDDARDTEVVRGCVDAIWPHNAGRFEWTFFEDSWTGSILIHRL